MTQFKDIDDFENLKMELSNEIAGNFIARLKEAGVPDTKLGEVTENVCYDIASAINFIGDLEITSTNHITDADEDKTDESASMLEEKTNDISAMLQEKTDDISAMLQERTDDITAMLQERTDEITGINDDSKSQDQVRHHVEGVLTQEKILQILNTAKSASN